MRFSSLPRSWNTWKTMSVCTSCPALWRPVMVLVKLPWLRRGSFCWPQADLDILISPDLGTLRFVSVHTCDYSIQTEKLVFVVTFWIMWTQEVKISTAPFLLLRIPSLKIKNSLRKEIFEANLKSESELWNLMIKEMWAGRMMADNHKVKFTCAVKYRRLRRYYRKFEIKMNHLPSLPT